MILIDIIQKAKNGDLAATDKILYSYYDFCYYMMNKYRIEDKESCYEEVKRNILKSIYTFKL